MPWSELKNENMASLIACVTPIDPPRRLQPRRHRRHRLLDGETDSQVNDRLGEQPENRRGADKLHLRVETIEGFRYLRPQLTTGVQPRLGRPAESQIAVVEPQPNRGQKIHGRIVSREWWHSTACAGASEISKPRQ